MKIWLVIIIILAISFSLFSGEFSYKEISHLYMRSIWENDRNLMVNISNHLEVLNDEAYESYQIFHLSVLVFSALGRYDKIESILDSVENTFNDRFEYWIVRGMVLERKKQDGTLLFLMAYEKFLKEYENENLAKLHFVYFLLLINEDIGNALLKLNDKEKEVADKYLALNRDELLKVSPFNLFHYEPVVFLEKKSDKDWWK